jgi:hypothetical protein
MGVPELMVQRQCNTVPFAVQWPCTVVHYGNIGKVGVGVLGTLGIFPLFGHTATGHCLVIFHAQIPFVVGIVQLIGLLNKIFLASEVALRVLQELYGLPDLVMVLKCGKGTGIVGEPIEHIKIRAVVLQLWKILAIALCYPIDETVGRCPEQFFFVGIAIAVDLLQQFTDNTGINTISTGKVYLSTAMTAIIQLQ